MSRLECWLRLLFRRSLSGKISTNRWLTGQWSNFEYIYPIIFPMLPRNYLWKSLTITKASRNLRCSPSSGFWWVMVGPTQRCSREGWAACRTQIATRVSIASKLNHGDPTLPTLSCGPKLKLEKPEGNRYDLDGDLGVRSRTALRPFAILYHRLQNAQRISRRLFVDS